MIEHKIDIQKEWFNKGKEYATAINDMVAFCEEFGWENWDKEEPEDEREQLASDVFQLLKKANKENNIELFRKQFPPSHAPFIELLKNKSQEIIHLEFVEKDKVVFIVQNEEKNSKVFLLDSDKITELNNQIEGIGKSKKGTVFALKIADEIIISKGWNGKRLATLKLNTTKNTKITQLIPFNEGLKVLLVSPKGIFIVSDKGEQKIHPVTNSDDWEADLMMENASLSTNNNYIIVGDLNSDHRVLTIEGEQIGTIGPQSSFPHLSLFSEDDTHMISNSCHFYNGVTIGIETKHLKGIELNAYVESDLFTLIENQMRVYAGITLDNYYILGDAFGYVKAFDKQGNCLWKHFLGSTVTAITISDDKQTLWVATGAGIIHKLLLNKGKRDTHTIGNSNHFEEFRMLFWKDEPILKW
jgi:hypothetical protein